MSDTDIVWHWHWLSSENFLFSFFIEISFFFLIFFGVLESSYFLIFHFSEISFSLFLFISWHYLTPSLTRFWHYLTLTLTQSWDCLTLTLTEFWNFWVPKIFWFHFFFKISCFFFICFLIGKKIKETDKNFKKRIYSSLSKWWLIHQQLRSYYIATSKIDKIFDFKAKSSDPEKQFLNCASRLFTQ